MIYTEKKSVYAPLEYHLKTSRKIKPGDYTLEFVFTYFNGKKWCSSVRTIQFRVQNILERYQILIGFVVVVGTALTIADFLMNNKILLASFLKRLSCLSTHFLIFNSVPREILRRYLVSFKEQDGL